MSDRPWDECTPWQSFQFIPISHCAQDKVGNFVYLGVQLGYDPANLQCSPVGWALLQGGLVEDCFSSAFTCGRETDELSNVMDQRVLVVDYYHGQRTFESGWPTSEVGQRPCSLDNHHPSRIWPICPMSYGDLWQTLSWTVTENSVRNTHVLSVEHDWLFHGLVPFGFVLFATEALVLIESALSGRLHFTGEDKLEFWREKICQVLQFFPGVRVRGPEISWKWLSSYSLNDNLGPFLDARCCHPTVCEDLFDLFMQFRCSCSSQAKSAGVYDTLRSIGGVQEVLKNFAKCAGKLLWDASASLVPPQWPSLQCVHQPCYCSESTVVFKSRCRLANTNQFKIQSVGSGQ